MQPLLLKQNIGAGFENGRARELESARREHWRSRELKREGFMHKVKSEKRGAKILGQIQSNGEKLVSFDPVHSYTDDVQRRIGL